MADPASIPWGAIAGVATVAFTAFTSAVGVLFKVLVADRIANGERERDDARHERDKMRRERDEFKAWWKASVKGQRHVRRELESTEYGAPSAPPPPPRRSDFDDETGSFMVIEAEDRAWQEARERERREKAMHDGSALPEREVRRLERYNRGDPLSTPPEELPRKRMPSRPR